MSTDDKLDGFKISDMKRPEVRSFQKTVSGDSGSDPEAQAPSSGFENVEQRLENGNIEDLADEIRDTYQKLEEMAATGDMKTKSSAQKAMAAYERTADLFEYLYATKETIQE
jgi:hypothetical protein